MASEQPVEIIELILEDELRENLEIIAELAGMPIEAVIVTACSRYVQFVNEHGFPRYTGVGFRMTEEEMDAVEAEDEAE